MSTPPNLATFRPGYQAPGPFGLDVGNVQPPVPLYIRKDEILRVQINNSQANVVVSVGWRMMMSDGQVVDSNVDFTPPSNRSAFVKTISMEEGYLLSLIVTASANAGKRGQTFVQVQQGRGNSAGLITPTALLVQDYVGSGLAASWPGGNIRPSTEGQGFLTSQGVTQPGVGAIWQLSPPANARWRIRAVQFNLVTSATAVNRIASVLFRGAQFGSAQVFSATAEPASSTFTYYFSAVPVSGFDGFTSVSVPAPVDNFMTSAGQMTGSAALLQAGDQFTAITVSVEEWIEP